MTNSARWALRWTAAVALAATLTVWPLGCAPDEHAIPEPPEGAELARLDFTLKDMNGKDVRLSDFRGQPMLINFWATWCAPCVRELPEFDRFHREFGGRGWQVVGLAIDGPTPVREFLGRVKVGFPIGLAGLDGTELVRALGNTQGGLPFSVMVNAAGRVVQRKLGETHFDELRGWAERA